MSCGSTCQLCVSDQQTCPSLPSTFSRWNADATPCERFFPLPHCADLRSTIGQGTSGNFSTRSGGLSYVVKEPKYPQNIYRCQSISISRIPSGRSSRSARRHAIEIFERTYIDKLLLRFKAP